MKPRILYLYWMLSANGRDHISCRQLIRELELEYEVERKHMVLPDEAYLQISDRALAREVIAETDFLDNAFDMVIFENNLGDLKDDATPKLRAEPFQQYVRQGGSVLFLAQGSNLFYMHGSERTTNAYMQRVGLPSFRLVRPGKGLVPQNFDQHLFGYDETTSTRRVRRSGGSARSTGAFAVEVSEDYLEGISPEFRPAYGGCQRLVLGSRPLHLGTLSKALLTGNRDTTKLITSGDLNWDDDFRPVFGVCNDALNGPLATVTGNIANDSVITMSPCDNLRFVRNLIEVLLNHQSEKSHLLGLPIGRGEVSRSDYEAASEVEIERRVNEIHERALHYRQQVSTEIEKESEEFLRVRLEKIWGSLAEESRDFLVTAEAMFRVQKNWNRDFAMPAVELCKVLEKEILVRLIQPFGDFVLRHPAFPEVEQHQRSVRRLNNLGVVLRGGQAEGKLLLGRFAREMRLVPSGNDRVYKMFREYVEGRCVKPAFWLDLMNPDGGPAMLLKIAEEYRNGSAHTESMTRQLMEEWRDRLLGIVRRPGLLEEVIESTAPKDH